jgi:hypothetical protein
MAGEVRKLVEGCQIRFFESEYLGEEREKMTEC